MKLKRVAMSGFKSFADKVEFDFAPGVTCIVGPNGCGKSNVVDSFKWVLGEQSARSLRGRQMLDMIFNGSASRKASSLAQVDLVFDNQDRALQLDCDEVSISRKLYRSGESEYLINQEPARLRDIREMFLDTGVGVHAYAVIEQGKVEALLHSSPTERRAIFEEAAGISKYKARKRDAERKLGRTEQNLLRVADIIDEVEGRLRRVKLQAGKARNFKAYDARLRELRASFSLAEYHRLSEEITGVSTALDTDRQSVDALRTGIRSDEQASIEIARLIQEIGEQIAIAENRLVALRSDLAANQERADSARARVGEQQANQQRANARLQQERHRYDQQAGELAALEEQATALEQQTQSQNAIIDDLGTREQELARGITQTQAQVEDEKAGVVDLLRRTAQLHNEINGLTKHSETLIGHKGRLSQRDEVIRSELEAVLRRRAALEEKLVEVDRLVARETEQLNEKKESARVIDIRRARVNEALASEKDRLSALRGRGQALRDLQQRMEGVGAGARQILDRKLTDPSNRANDDVLGLVADVFDTDVPRAHIIEAAIGEHDQYLVVRNSGRLLHDPALRHGLPERTTVLCLDRLPPARAPRDFADQPGFVARALEFVRFDASLADLADNVLGHTIVVDTLSNALAMAREDATGHRFVTLAGEVVEPAGAVRVGPPASHAGLISRRSELRSIEEQIVVHEKRVNQLSDELNHQSAQTTHLEQVQQELRAAIYELHTVRVENKAALENVDEVVRRLSSEQPLIASEVAIIEKDLADAAARAHANRSSLTELEAASEIREQQVRLYQEQLESMTGQRDELVARLTDARVSAGKLMEKRSATAETISALRRGIRTAEEGVAAAEHEIADCAARISEAEATIAGCFEQIAALSTQSAELEREAERTRGERDDLQARQTALAEQLRSRREALTELEDKLHEHQLALQAAEIRRNELVSRVRAELAIELAETYAQYEHSEQDWEAIEAEIAELKQKIERLGNINLDAIQEQQELEERAAFLVSQRDDLDVARKQLDTLIEQLNEECVKRFADVFEDIRINFRELFRKLFGGGKADIILEDPTDLLDTGIEILAKPPGKELQSITLLSGGEKSMTAIALLMSIFRSRPSPFAILDEVDAALDEANNERFNGIIRQFLDRSQFIIITHSKRTMSIGDQMYGVTMQEPGVSTRVSVRFEQVDDVGASAVA